MHRSKILTLLRANQATGTLGAWLLVLPLIAMICPLSIWGQEGPERPNLIIIFCDNLGYGDIEPFGSTLHRTPHLNRMAKEGRKFTHFYVSAGVCTPSRASLMTGCYAQRIGMHTNPRDGQVLRPVSPYGLHPNELTIAEVLQQAGYATGIFGKWHLGDQPAFLPTRQGFDQFFGTPYSDDMTQAVGRRLGDRFDGNRWPPLPLMLNETVVESPADRNLLTRQLTDKAVEFIESNQQRPFFLYFPQAMPGSTSEPFASPEFRGKSANGAWGDSIEELDWSTGQLLDKVVELGLAEKTLVVWTSDNGAPLARDPREPIRGSNQPLHGRGYTTGEGAFRVPTIFWWPSHVPAGTTCDDVAGTIDLMPTFARFAHASTNFDRPIDGRDIGPLILGAPNAQSPHEAIYFYAQEQLQAVRSGRWKLFLALDSFSRHPHFKKGQGSKPLLFDVVEDVGCTNNVADEHPSVLASLTRIANDARTELGDRGKVGVAVRARGRVSNPIPVAGPTVAP